MATLRTLWLKKVPRVNGSHACPQKDQEQSDGYYEYFPYTAEKGILTPQRYKYGNVRAQTP
eukprot:6462504-Amphidinium_carterae.1